MQGVLHRFHGRERAVRVTTESTLFTAAAVLVALVTLLILVLGVFVTRAS